MSLLNLYKAKQVSQKKEKEKKPSAPSGETADVPNELITPELHKESYQSVSKHLGQKFLMDSLGAMHSSMVRTSISLVTSEMVETARYKFFFGLCVAPNCSKQWNGLTHVSHKVKR